jgi:hypothetical protein
MKIPVAIFLIVMCSDIWWDTNVSEYHAVSLKMEAALYPEARYDITTWHHNPEDHGLNFHPREHINSRKY